MQIGNYQLGRLHAIIKKSYADGSYDYETSFRDEADLTSSIVSMQRCIGRTVGQYTDNPRVLTGVEVIRGKEDIAAELSSKQG